MYHSLSSGQSRCTKLMPSIAASGTIVVLLGGNPAACRNGFIDSWISSNRALDHPTWPGTALAE